MPWSQFNFGSPSTPLATTDAQTSSSSKIENNNTMKNPKKSVVQQRIEEVENRIKNNNNPLLVPTPPQIGTAPPTHKLDGPKINHFNKPRY